MAKIDPRLKRALKQGGQVQASFTLKDNEGRLLKPEETDTIAKKIVSKAAKESKAGVHKLVVFKNLQSFSVNAPADLVQKLTDDEAVGTAALGS
jgi:hypothetical protein